ncbi:MAG TPA: hypothetical protein PLA68_09095 [Panacibacter sp.]|nr:hypothetical protein [Panacibacter sp.]
MKFRLLFSALFLITAGAIAQPVTGIWRGYFNSGYGQFKQQFKFEVQINQLVNNAVQKGIQGVTYSYRSTVFYGKASMQGIYDSKNKSLTIKETELVELKISDRTEPCLMTCFLDYHKDGKTEILEGSFTSVNANTKGDCGAGYVYLEKVEESDFVKEDFLIHKTPQPKVKPPVSTPVIKDKPVTAQQKKTTAPPVVKKTVPVITVPKNNQGSVSKNPPQKKPPVSTGKDTIVKSNPVIPPPVTAPEQQEIVKKIIPVPDVIKERDNPLIKTIVTNSQNILIQLYDNGEIDGDTITVYDNNEVIAFKKGLTAKAITLNIKADIYNAHHEFVMVANNVGSIPPNTALMIVTTGGKRYELFISSDDKKNAKVVIDFKMPGKETK